ncbi:PRC-barrel domain-containing protein [Wenxinia marina]|uniref:PRC-barrel domain protein n=1 Tax=Wenxinia marina DSM 24838 TaxID=1123501 RepID=A0A0D0PBI5_9RHOB|nr:PRC-barrel domain-containing protein [Wenxinia marina]KIQ68786.1 PRC-barrel domain protein [Wenxinia marina DSM 24838]GGL65189.1 hypothetical protein GCM10011392_19860 [Wenxinia marina]
MHIRKMTLTTATLALATGLSGAALAEQHMTGVSEDGYASGMVSTENMGNLIRTSELTDGDVYTLDADIGEADWDSVGYYNEVDTDWDQIGNVTDVVLSPDGTMAGLVVETGGFLDIGDSHVIVTSDDVRMVRSAGVDQYSFVTRLSEEQLANLPEVGENWW